MDYLKLIKIKIMDKNKNTKYLIQITSNKNKPQTVAQIKFKSKYNELNANDKIEILREIIRWGREEMWNQYPEQE